MDAKDKLLKAIEEFLGEYARWARRAGGSRSDAVEEFYRELLNRAFGYQLKNMNREKGNYPGIDLADDAAGVAVHRHAAIYLLNVCLGCDTELWAKFNPCNVVAVGRENLCLHNSLFYWGYCYLLFSDAKI